MKDNTTYTGNRTNKLQLSLYSTKNTILSSNIICNSILSNAIKDEHKITIKIGYAEFNVFPNFRNITNNVKVIKSKCLITKILEELPTNFNNKTHKVYLQGILMGKRKLVFSIKNIIIQERKVKTTTIAI